MLDGRGKPRKDKSLPDPTKPGENHHNGVIYTIYRHQTPSPPPWYHVNHLQQNDDLILPISWDRHVPGNDGVKPPHRVRVESGTCVGGGRRKGPFLPLSGGMESETSVFTTY